MASAPRHHLFENIKLHSICHDYDYGAVILRKFSACTEEHGIHT